MRRPLELRTTLTGFPARQFLDSAPSLSFRGASQFKASALQEIRELGVYHIGLRMRKVNE